MIKTCFSKRRSRDIIRERRKLDEELEREN